MENISKVLNSDFNPVLVMYSPRSAKWTSVLAQNTQMPVTAILRQ